MSENKTAPSFKNEATRRFYQFFREKIDGKKISVKDLAAGFKVFEKNPSQLLVNMKSGKVSVTIDQLYTAWEVFGLDPAHLFSTTPELSGTNAANEESPTYQSKANITTGSILHEILRKHNTPIKKYAENNLEISEQQMYNILSGKSRPYFDTVRTVCEDHAESLDQFRTRPLPMGHVLERLRLLEEIVEQKDAEIAALKSKNP